MVFVSISYTKKSFENKLNVDMKEYLATQYASKLRDMKKLTYDYLSLIILMNNIDLVM